MPTVTVRFSMAVEFPGRLSKRDRKLLQRCVAACAYLDANREASADTSNFADTVDAMEQMASVVRRAKASRHNAED